MLEDGRITGRQFTTLIFMIITSVTILQIPPLVIGLAGQDSWLSVVIAVVIDGIVAAVLYFLGLKYPGKTFIQYSEDILGGSRASWLQSCLFSFSCLWPASRCGP